MKRCRTCKQEKESADFYLGRHSCKGCVKLRVSNKAQADKDSGFCVRHPKEAMPCSRCRTEKTRRTLEGKCKSHPSMDLLKGKSECETCRENGWLRRYSVDTEFFTTLLIRQNAACAICLVKFKELGRSPQIDHDHFSKVVRGLLCGPCNRAIGIFKDSAEIALRAARYLETHGNR